MQQTLTYKKSGIDRKAVYTLTKQINPSWGFAGLAELNRYTENMKDPLLVMHTDNVGTKAWIAVQFNKLNSIGQDLVAMNVNDIATLGAKPLFFLDYFSAHKFNSKQFKIVLNSIRKSCKDTGMKLMGGETSIYPLTDKSSESNRIDISGFVVGLVSKQNLLKRENVKLGDKIIGIASSGVHSNGYSLIRKAIHGNMINVNDRINGSKIVDTLMIPTFLYSDMMISLVQSLKSRIRIGANITGGAFYKNIPRVIPDSMTANIYYNSWKILPIFEYIKDQCNVSTKEMLTTFNMGVGFTVIVDKNAIESAERVIGSFGFNSYVIGEITKNMDKTKIRFIF